MPRFVILHHVWPAHRTRAAHYDLMFEHGDVLRTWAIAGPLKPTCSRLAEQLPDHRTMYLDYEGPVSNDRGEVTRWACGEYEPLLISDDRWELLLRSDAWVYRLALVRDEVLSAHWTLSCEAVSAGRP